MSSWEFVSEFLGDDLDWTSGPTAAQLGCPAPPMMRPRCLARGESMLDMTSESMGPSDDDEPELENMIDVNYSIPTVKDIDNLDLRGTTPNLDFQLTDAEVSKMPPLRLPPLRAPGVDFRSQSVVPSTQELGVDGFYAQYAASDEFLEILSAATGGDVTPCPHTCRQWPDVKSPGEEERATPETPLGAWFSIANVLSLDPPMRAPPIKTLMM